MTLPQTMEEVAKSVLSLLGKGIYTKEEEKFLTMRFAWGLTMNECAIKTHQTRERIRIREAKALRKWRAVVDRDPVREKEPLTTTQLHAALPVLLRTGGKVRVQINGRVVASVEFVNFTDFNSMAGAQCATHTH
jgi:hypothetical protein